MKKILLSFLVVLLFGALVISCDSSVQSVSDEIATVNFATGMERALSSSIAYIEVTSPNLEWYYKAIPAQGAKFTHGAKSEWTKLEGGLSATIELSQGLWSFNLQAKYNDEVVYEGNTTDVLIKKQSTSVPVKINVSPVASGKGTIEFSSITIKGIDSTPEQNVSHPANKAVITNKASNAKINLDLSNTLVTQTVNSGSYSVTVSFEENGIVYGIETLDVTVYSGSTVTISGYISEDSQSAIFNPSLQVPLTTFSKQLPVVPSSIDVAQKTATVSEKTTITNGSLVVIYPAGTLIKESNPDSNTNTADAKTGVEFVSNELSDSSSNNGIVLFNYEGAISQYDLSLNVPDSNRTLLTVKMNIEEDLVITRVLHKGTPLAKAPALEGEPLKEYYEYNDDEGLLTLYVFHASPIEIITAKPVPSSCDILVTIDGTPVAFNIEDYAEEVKQWNAGTYVDAVNGWQINNAGGPFNAEYVTLCHAFWAASNGLGDVETSIVLNTDLETKGKYYSDIFRSDEEGTYTKYGRTAMKYFAEIPNVTLDLNGHTINMDATSQSGSAISVYNANLTIKDSVGGGGISSHCYSTLCHLGNTLITIENGTFTTDVINGRYHGMAIMSGGDYVENATADGYMPGQIKLTGGTFTFDYMDGNGGTKENPATVKQHFSSYPSRYEGYDENTPIGVFYYLEDGEIPAGYTYRDNGNGTFTVVPATNE